MTYSTDMEAAKNLTDMERIILLVPTGDLGAPISEEIGHWDAGLGRFEGEWRYVEDMNGAGSVFASMDPIAWCHVPDIPDHIMRMAVGMVTKAA